MFGDNLKKYRIEKGFTQNDLAEKLFVTRQCVSKWEKGVTQPDLQTLTQLSRILDVSVDTLVNGDASPEYANTSNLNKVFFVVNLLIAIFCLLAFFAVWRFLPQNIPAHWTNGQIDRYGSRNEVLLNLITAVVLYAADIFLFILFKRLGSNRVICISHGIIALFQAAYLIFIIALYAAHLTDVLAYINCLSADLLLCVSIAMHPKINKRNRILGIRTHETLASVNVWNKTNTLASYMFFVCSFIIFAVNILWTSKFSLLLFPSYILITVILVIYSKKIGKSVD